jgi:hypothetical protein
MHPEHSPQTIAGPFKALQRGSLARALPAVLYDVLLAFLLVRPMFI